MSDTDRAVTRASDLLLDAGIDDQIVRTVLFELSQADLLLPDGHVPIDMRRLTDDAIDTAVETYTTGSTLWESCWREKRRRSR